jgi:secondary thiamine-phosphate synthase enzyme
MVKTYKISILTQGHYDMQKITDKMRAAVGKSGILEGLTVAITAHTTTGITVNEGLECLERDMETMLRCLVPEEGEYAHAHWLPTYGRTSANVTGHLRSFLTGNHCVFPVEDGHMVCGAAQDVYFCEYDGPQDRAITIVVLGE